MTWFDIIKVLLLAFACTVGYVVTEKKPSLDRRSVMFENASVVSRGFGSLEEIRGSGEDDHYRQQ